MKYFLAVIVLLSTGIGYYWWTSATTPTNEDKTDVISTTTQSQNPAPETETTAKLDHQVYTNNTWGIKFNYPNDWEIREPAFKSSVSLFNLSIDPKLYRKYPDTVLINITPKDWIVGALKKMTSRGVQTQESYVSGFNAIKIEDQDSGIPTISYLVLINDSYWIDISGKKGYEAKLNQVLDSLEITPVEINGIE